MTDETYISTEKPAFKTKAGEHLQIEVAVYVPSTDYDKPVSSSVLAKRVAQTRKKMAEIFGGFTQDSVVGGWVDQAKGKTIMEKVVKVTIFARSGGFKKNKRLLIDFLRRKKKEWKQAKLSVEYEGDLYMI